MFCAKKEFFKRLSVLFCMVALFTVVMGGASAALASVVTLVLPDLSADPAAVFDYEWSVAKHKSEALFYMKSDGSIVEITNTGIKFKNAETIYVAAHGGNDYVGGFSYGNFVTYFEAAHAAIPDEVFFAVCASGNGPDSLLKQLNTEYGGNINTLSGGVVACALTGNGDPSLASAEYRIRVTPSDPILYNKIQDNIMHKWDNAYPGSLNDYKTVGDSYANPFNQANMESFVNTVYAQFSQAPQSGIPDDSTNYLDLIRLNTGGDPMTVCGASPGGSAVAVPCP